MMKQLQAFKFRLIRTLSQRQSHRRFCNRDLLVFDKAWMLWQKTYSCNFKAHLFLLGQEEIVRIRKKSIEVFLQVFQKSLRNIKSAEKNLFVQCIIFPSECQMKMSIPIYNVIQFVRLHTTFSDSWFDVKSRLQTIHYYIVNHIHKNFPYHTSSQISQNHVIAWDRNWQVKKIFPS